MDRPDCAVVGAVPDLGYDPRFSELANGWIDEWWIDAENGKLLPSDTGRPRLLLRKFAAKAREKAKDAVLLVHGASANSRTFVMPQGGLVRYLLGRSLDVWTLDWRGSSLLTDEMRQRVPPEKWSEFSSIDNAAEIELLHALKKMKKEYAGKVAVIGHCVGGALVAKGILGRPKVDPDGARSAERAADDCAERDTEHATKRVTYDDTERVVDHVDRVVFTTLGVFFRVGLENWFKGNERVFEGLVNRDYHAGWASISPWAATDDTAFGWPRALDKLFRLWQRTPVPHRCSNPFCHRVSFMFGMPYNPSLVERMHAVRVADAPPSLREGGPEHGFWSQFGDMPVGLYRDVTRSLRQGWLATAAGVPSAPPVRDNFTKLHVTLITGNENQLWHRESVDFMYEWLRRPNPTPPEERPRLSKYVAPGFGHQDLYWCEEPARRELIYERLWRAIVRA